MSEPNKTPTLLGEALRSEIKALIREVLQEALASNGKPGGLLTPEELADRLKVPLTWIYEQSRQGKIPTHRVGRYIRFNLAEVLASQNNK